jgi:hypothetical protein
MANEVLQKEGTMLVFGVSGSFNPADDGTNMTNGGSVTDTLTLAGVADGAARQSAKADLGATRAAAYAVMGCVDFTGETPTAGDTVDYYWAPSSDGTAGEGNVAGNSGGDADCPDGALGSITLAEFLKQCIFIGKLKIHDGASVQCGFVGILSPPTRYGQLIAVNESGDAFEDDDVEAHQVLVPIIDEVQ